MRVSSNFRNTFLEISYYVFNDAKFHFWNLLHVGAWALSIYKFSLSGWVFVCLSVYLYPVNVKTAEPIGPKFFVWTSRDHREGL